jgi:hypothetical protein
MSRVHVCELSHCIACCGSTHGGRTDPVSFFGGHGESLHMASKNANINVQWINVSQCPPAQREHTLVATADVHLAISFNRLHRAVLARKIIL